MDNIEPKKIAKSFVGYAIGGVLFFLIAGGITSFYASTVGFESGNEIQQFTEQIVTLQPYGILFSFGLFVILGFLALAFAWITIAIRIHLFGEKEHEVKFIKKRFLLPLAGVGLATFVILSVIGQISTGISTTTDLTNPMTLLDAIVQQNVGAFASSLILFALTGWAIIWVAKKTPAIEDIADKTRLNKI